MNTLAFIPSALPHVLGSLPPGVDGVRETLRLMVRLARQYKKDVGIITLARQLTDSLLPYDRIGEITALQHFVRDRIRYVRDVHGVETLQTPIRTLEIRSGDCDDKSILLASLLSSIGFPARFVALGFNGGPYSHVLVEVQHGKRWLPLETILADREPGWYPDNITRRMEWHL